MFNIVLSDNKNHETVVFRNMEYNTAFNIASHLNTLNAAAAKRMGQAVVTFFSIIKGN